MKKNKIPALDNQLANEIAFRRRMLISTWITLTLPPVTGIFMLSFVGVFPFPEVFYPFTDYGAVVFAVCTIIALRVNKRFTTHIINLANAETITEVEQKHLKRLPVYYFSALFVYFGTGLFTTLYSLSSLHGFDYGYQKYVTSFLGIIPGTLITALPTFFYLTDALGKYLAPQGIHISIAPIRLKLIVLGLFVPILIDTLLLMYFSDRTGYFSLETFGIWFFLIGIAAIGTFMAWKSFRQSMSPFFISLIDNTQNDHSQMHITPQSLDELGILSSQWQELWKKIIQYENNLYNSNQQLEGSVRKRTAELEKEKNFIDTVLEYAGALVIVMDHDGHIVRFNKTCEDVTGFQLNELRNQPVWEWLIPEEHKPAVIEVFKNLTNTGLKSQYENDILKRDGSRRLIAWNNSVVLANDGMVENIVSIGIDITERNIVEQELKLAKEEAERANNSKTQFLSSMSHELRTPMNAILGFSQLLKQSDLYKLPSEQEEFVDEITQAGQHLLELINEVLDLAKIEQGKLPVNIEDIDLASIISDSISLLEPLAQQRKIKIENKIHPGQNYFARADRLRFKQVFINLLSNAIKYNFNNGSVHIKINSLPDTLRISVQDTGPGIPSDKMHRLFVPFERLGNSDTEIEGTGIGLAISKKLMALMHGQIGVESTEGKGSLFFIELPKATATYFDKNPVAESAEVISLSSSSVKQYTVLYVEDNPANLRLVSHIIEKRKDINLLTAHTGNLGLDLALTHMPDFILLDINLPGMNGKQVLQKLKTNNLTAQIPVAAITANAMHHDIQAGFAAGFCEYMVKPLNIKKFIEMMEKYLPSQSDTKNN